MFMLLAKNYVFVISTVTSFQNLLLMDKCGCEVDIFKRSYLNFKIVSTLSPLGWRFWPFAKNSNFLGTYFETKNQTWKNKQCWLIIYKIKYRTHLNPHYWALSQWEKIPFEIKKTNKEAARKNGCTTKSKADENSIIGCAKVLVFYFIFLFF